MKVKEMLGCLKRSVNVEFRNKNDMFICHTESDCEGVLPYMDRSVFEWIPSCNIGDRKIFVWLEDESEGEE